MIPQELLKVMQEYTRSVLDNKLRCDWKVCPCCGRVPEQAFKFHDCRNRTFRMIVEQFVIKVLSFLTRWKCSLCGQKATFYPPFGAPHKRYVTAAIMDRSFRYVEDDRATYRSAVREKTKVPGYTTGVGYTTADDGRTDERQLAHATVHRWLTWLGSLRETLRMALTLIKAKAMDSAIFRQVFPVPPWKYRSDERRLCLGACRRLFRVDRECRRLSFPPVIPSFGTACRWT
jgi:hypothetical protein